MKRITFFAFGREVPAAGAARTWNAGELSPTCNRSGENAPASTSGRTLRRSSNSAPASRGRADGRAWARSQARIVTVFEALPEVAPDAEVPAAVAATTLGPAMPRAAS